MIKPNNDSEQSRELPGPDNNYGFPSGFGEAGKDFPIIDPNNIPKTSFSCEDKVVGG